MKVKFFFTLILLILVSAMFVVVPRVLIINEITCTNQFGTCNVYIDDKLKSFIGSNLSLVKRGIKDYLSNEVLVSDYSVHLRLPSRLQIQVVERKVKFALTNSKKAAYLLIDDSGLVTKIVTSTNLPVAKVDGPLPNVGDRVDKQYLFALNLVYSSFYLYQTKLGTVVDERLEVVLDKGLRVIFPLSGEVEILLSSLQLILARLNTEAEGFRIRETGGSFTPVNVIDLRFKNPIVK